MIDIEDVANGDFVNQLYRNFFGREPDASGFSYWSSALSNGQQNAASVTRDFLSSAELQNFYAPIVQLYLAAFNRIPDAGGFDYWIRDYRNGASLSDIAAGMAASDEFKTLYGQSSDEQFIKDLYRNTFSRQPDVPGESFWNAVLDIGVPRSAVIASFATSQEMLRTRSEEVDYILLHRAIFGEFPTREVVDAALPVTNWAALIEKLYESQQYDGVDVPGLDRYEPPAPEPEPEPQPEPEPDPGPPPDSTAPTILAFTVSSPSTLSVTSSEPGTAGLYNGSTLTGSQTTLVNANTPYTLSVSAQPSPTNALLKVADNVGNVTTSSTHVFIGTDNNDSHVGANSTSNFIFGFDGHDTLVGGDENDVLSGGAGNDLLTGGLGFNTFYIDDYSSDAITDLKPGDTLNVSAYAFVSVGLMDLTTVSVNNSGVITIDGTSNADSVNGSSGQDIVYGFSGADTISGGHGNDQLEGGEGNDFLTGGAGVDQLLGGNGTDAIIIAATTDDAVGELYDGGNGTDDYLYISGTTVVDLRDDTVTNIETLNMSGSSSAQTLTLLASQLSGFTLGVSADSSDSMIVRNMTGGTMSSSSGTDSFVWGDTDSGMNRISGFNQHTDKLRFDFVLNQGSDGAAVTTIDETNDLSANSLLYTGFGTWSFAQAGKATYVMYLSIGGFDAATASGNAANTTNGIDFATASEANILANIEAALENTSDGGGVGIISRVNGLGVINGVAGTDIVFLLDDGDDTAVIRYQEGGSSEADYAGELTLLGVVTGKTGGDFNPFWNGNIYALFA